MKKSSQKTNELNDLRQSLHQKARTTKKSQKPQQHSSLYKLLEEVKSNHICIKPQYNIFLKDITINQNTSITISPDQQELSYLSTIVQKQNINSIRSSNNQKIKILDFDFSKFPNISTMSMSEGVIENIDNAIFEKTKLSQIILQKNKIQVIEKLPRFPYRLRYLGLSNNKIISLDFLKKSDLRNLTKLDLSNNLISSIQPLIQTDLKYLLQLFLSKNKIKSMTPFKYIDFKNLKKLDLSQNQISSIQQIKSIKISSFNWIQLSNNLITDFTPILKMKTKKDVYVFSVYVQDYFPGIYIRQNKADAEELKEIFKNTKYILCTDQIEEDAWGELYQKFGRYDNYGKDQRMIEKKIRDQEQNSVQGDILTDLQQFEEDQNEEEEEEEQKQGQQNQNEIKSSDTQILPQISPQQGQQEIINSKNQQE